MGAFLSKSNNEKLAKSNKRSAAKPQLNASTNANTTDMTTLADDSTCTLAADVSAISAPPTDAADESLATPATPQTQKFIDPRSPFVCRTPIDARGGSPATTPFAVTKRLDLTTDGDAMSLLSTPTSRLPVVQKTALQQKLLKNLGYQEFDPRSPTQFINRTPMRLGGELMGMEPAAAVTATASEVHANAEEANNALNESMDRPTESVNNEINESIQATELPADVEDTIAVDVAVAAESTVIQINTNTSTESEAITPPAKTATAAVPSEDLVDDPRSPSTNVDRTPIVLNAVADDAGLDTVDSSDDNRPALPQSSLAQLPTTTNDIFQDVAEPENACVTPRKTQIAVAKKSNEAMQLPRTPLGCLANLNKGRQPLLASGHKQLKHPILFVGKHQKQQPQQQTHDSKIPVMKSIGGGGSTSNVWKM